MQLTIFLKADTKHGVINLHKEKWHSKPVKCFIALTALGETEMWPYWKKSFKNFLMSKKCSLWHFSYLSCHQVHTNRKTQPCAAHTEQNWCEGFEERPQKIWGALSCGNLMKSMDSVAPGCWQTFGVTYRLGVAFRHSEKVFQIAEASKWRRHHSWSFASHVWQRNSGDSTGVVVCLRKVVVSTCIWVKQTRV